MTLARILAGQDITAGFLNSGLPTTIVPLAMSAGWGAAVSGWGVVSVRLLNAVTAKVAGACNAGTLTDTTVIATLDPAYRPTTSQTKTCAVLLPRGSQFFQVDVNSDGTIKLRGALTGVTAAAFDFDITLDL